ncbi:hypothetical protein GOP47_0029863 [Adiantum capillus-veneris]|nr:hypothetical protein GOP47_0029863 [Adiantum capillus-veneris]
MQSKKRTWVVGGCPDVATQGWELPNTWQMTAVFRSTKHFTLTKFLTPTPWPYPSFITTLRLLLCLVIDSSIFSTFCMDHWLWVAAYLDHGCGWQHTKIMADLVGVGHALTRSFNNVSRTQVIQELHSFLKSLQDYIQQTPQ